MAHNVNAAQSSEELLETILRRSTNIGKKLMGKKISEFNSLRFEQCKTFTDNSAAFCLFADIFTNPLFTLPKKKIDLS